MTTLAPLASLIDRHAPGDGMHATIIPRLSLIRSSTPTTPTPAVYTPMLCLVAQGSKRVMLGDATFAYDADTCLVVSVDLPLVGAIVEASADRPYLCVGIELDLPVVADLMLGHGIPGAAAGEAPPGLATTRATPDLIDAATRLVRLLDAPDDAAALAPLVEREILYRLLRGAQATMMRHIATGTSRLGQIARAIAWLRRHYAESFAVERIAAEARMSASAFHQHFRAVTAMSPLAFRNQLRLQEARRLMVAGGLDAADAGFRVGYESPSQFSRDYARAFGAPPSRDAARLRADPGYALVA